jgi:hypothetical protein
MNKKELKIASDAYKLIPVSAATLLELKERDPLMYSSICNERTGQSMLHLHRNGH